MTIDQISPGSLVRFTAGGTLFYGIFESCSLWHAIGENGMYAAYFKGRAEPVWFPPTVPVELVASSN